MLIHTVSGEQPTESWLWCEQQHLSVGKSHPGEMVQCIIILQSCHPRCLTSVSREDAFLRVLCTENM